MKLKLEHRRQRVRCYEMQLPDERIAQCLKIFRCELFSNSSLKLVSDQKITSQGNVEVIVLHGLLLPRRLDLKFNLERAFFTGHPVLEDLSNERDITVHKNLTCELLFDAHIELLSYRKLLSQGCAKVMLHELSPP